MHSLFGSGILMSPQDTDDQQSGLEEDLASIVAFAVVDRASSHKKRRAKAETFLTSCSKTSRLLSKPWGKFKFSDNHLRAQLLGATLNRHVRLRRVLDLVVEYCEHIDELRDASESTLVLELLNDQSLKLHIAGRLLAARRYDKR